MKIIIALAFAILLTACSQKKTDTKAEGEKLMQLSREWSQVAASGDVEKTLSYWADDATMLSEGLTPLKGKAEIRKMVEESFKIPGFKISWEPLSVEVSSSGDMAYVLENSHISYTDSTGKIATQHNKAVTIWRKQPDGSWKNVVDISTPGTIQ